jgi:hypothetical protein
MKNTPIKRNRLIEFGQILRVCLFGGWLMLICSERKILLADCWWLIYSERKVLLSGG